MAGYVTACMTEINHGEFFLESSAACEGHVGN